MCTLEKRGNIFLLTLTGTDEHRLHPNLIDSLAAALRRLRSESASSSSALITTAQGKFFSNGYDLKWALVDKARPQLMSKKLRALVYDLITLPMPTIAAVTGHASAAGFIFALSHDYVLMRKDRGFLYMSELDIGFKIPIWFSALLKCKVGSPAVWREVVLKSAKMTAEMGVEMGIVDSAHSGAEETVEAAVRLGEELMSRNWDGKVYADCRKTLYVELLNSLGSDETVGDYGKEEEPNKNLSRL
ncbi:enoyl-CoA delta isomerase 1, peroxisomal [Nicotiana tomentosiformis]|uniref:enoyl-CoA delta isomerase 1, peroxisomal n=1 Tax=Nicotiana tomentosiformis TaxID=4098 RepID=UPI00051C0561|nr:enoyl-CoA delta isomerase 1, peroxisomal [Nicotiana tomentosiformis]XP_018622350.1 enoyl-CoA delta isomerase 1, peroxisomal [Nicotiana tomentosiformis]